MVNLSLIGVGVVAVVAGLLLILALGSSGIALIGWGFLILGFILIGAGMFIPDVSSKRGR